MKKNNYWGKRYLNILDDKLNEADEQLIKEYNELLNRTKLSLYKLYDDNMGRTDLYTFNKYYEFCNKLENELIKLGINQSSILDTSLKGMYRDVKTQLGNILNVPIGDDFAGFNPGESIIKQVWCADGKDWSQRIWTNTEKLKDELTTGLFDIWVRGSGTKDTIDKIEQLVDNSVGNAHSRAKTLVNTELAHIGTLSQLEIYRKAGFEAVMVKTMGDSKVCKEDQQHDGKIVPILEIEEGVNIPPFHPNCRCFIIGVDKL